MKLVQIYRIMYKQTTREDQMLAEAFVPYLKRTYENIHEKNEFGINIQIQETGDQITLPIKALLLLTEILDKMAQGKSVTIVPTDSEITTQKAAEILNVSRPYVVKILEEGQIPFNKVGSHRRVKLSDIIAFDKTLREQRKENMAFLAEQAQKLNLGYE